MALPLFAFYTNIYITFGLYLKINQMAIKIYRDGNFVVIERNGNIQRKSVNETGIVYDTLGGNVKITSGGTLTADFGVNQSATALSAADGIPFASIAAAKTYLDTVFIDATAGGGVTPSSNTTFTNKSISGNDNTITNIPDSALSPVAQGFIRVMNDSPMVFFGDSITENGRVVSGTTVGWLSRGYSAYAQFLSGNKLIPTNLGVGGNTTAQMVLRLVAAQNLNPKVAVVLAGANDIIGATTSADIISNIKIILDGFLAKESKVIAITILPQFASYTPTAPREAVRVAVNNYIKSRTDIMVIDADLIMNNASYYIDGLHPNDVGAYILGGAVATKLNSFLDGNSIAGILSTGLGFTDNVLQTGTGGSKTGGIATGSVAANWELDATAAGGATVVGSKSADDKQVITISGNYTGNNRVIEYAQSFTTTPPLTGSILEELIEFEVSGTFTNIVSVHAQVQVYTAGFASVIANQYGISNFDNTTLFQLPMGKYTDRTAKVAIGAGTPAIVVTKLRITFKDTAVSTPVSGVVKINRAGTRQQNVTINSGGVEMWATATGLYVKIGGVTKTVTLI